MSAQSSYGGSLLGEVVGSVDVFPRRAHGGRGVGGGCGGVVRHDGRRCREIWRDEEISTLAAFERRERKRSCHNS